MSERQSILQPPLRKEYILRPASAAEHGDVARALSPWERLTNVNVLRKIVVLLGIVAIWQLYATPLNNPLMFPTFDATAVALWDAVVNGSLIAKSWVSVKTLLVGFSIGVALALTMTCLAVTFRLAADFLETLAAMFNPMPSIALLPMALLWFGLNDKSLIFVLCMSVVWTLSLSTFSGFRSVSPTLRMIGRNYGLGGPSYIFKILVPAAFPSILAGLKLGWLYSWRTLVAAELVFGTSSWSEGLGYFIYQNKAELQIAYVFSGLFSIILVGFLVENLIFRRIELRTVRKWGMQS